MTKPDFIQTDGGLILRAAILGVDTSNLEKEGYILIQHEKGVSRASHIQAFEALMLLKPSVLEGLRLKYGKGTWIFHNLVSHPLMQFVALGAMLVRPISADIGHAMYNLAVSIHDSTVPIPQSGKLWEQSEIKIESNLVGKKILITAGACHEDIDGVRHYTNNKRSEGQGFAVANLLRSFGAEVTIVTAKTHLPTPTNCKIIDTDSKKHKITSGQGLLEVTHEVLASDNFDAIISLASLSSIKAEQISAHKIKAKKDVNTTVSLAVIGNEGIEDMLHSTKTPILGYNKRQELFASPDAPQWLEGMADKIRPLEQVTSEFLGIEASPQRPVPQLLRGKTVIMTGGPTAEAVTTTGDVITNFSSGRQSHYVARTFAEYGAKVIYVLGPTNLPAPVHRNIEVIQCSSARSMLRECQRSLPADIFIGVAAVADFGAPSPEDLYLSQGQKHNFILEQNPDILEFMGKHKSQRPQLVIGFAAETDPENILDYAAGKLNRKGADMICANLVGSAIAERGSSNNQITIVTSDHTPIKLDVMSKEAAAASIVKYAHSIMEERAPKISSAMELHHN